MEENLSKFITAIIAIFILFVFPVYIAYEKKDDISYALAVRYTQDFVDSVRSKGYVTQELYQDYAASLLTTGNTYSIELEHEYVRYDSESASLSTTGSAVRNTELYGTNHILNVLNSGDRYVMNVNDNFNVKIRNTNVTFATILYNIVTVNMSNNTTRIYVDYGGKILAEKWYATDLNYSKYGGVTLDEAFKIEISATNVDSSRINKIPEGLHVGDTVIYPKAGIEWVYLGLDEEGNILLTSKLPTEIYDISKVDGFVNGATKMDNYCNSLYGSTIGTARNMKIEDVNRVLGYDGPLGRYVDNSGSSKYTTTPKKIGDLDLDITYTSMPSGMKALNEYYANGYWYQPSDYISTTSNEYKLICLSEWYWLSSPAVLVEDDYVEFSMHSVNNSYVRRMLDLLFVSYNTVLVEM